MSYTRVIPRDFFNEAKLLKCMGQLSLKILDQKVPAGIKIEIDESGEPFVICQAPHDGHLFISNYEVSINGTRVNMHTTYNSKDVFPLICYYEEEETQVFDNWGNFTDEFIQLANNIN